MNKHTHMTRALALVALAFGLQGCIDATNAPPPEPDLCRPLAVTTYKGGNTWGEELTVSLDPATMAYTITIDASIQPGRTGTTHAGTLEPLERECTYSSDEDGAVFTLAPGGVLQGGVSAPSGSAFAALLAFRDTWNNATDLTVFNPVADYYNLIGVHSNGSVTESYAASTRVRVAGTYHLCRDTTNGFIVYANACSNTMRGYFTYQSSRNAFDMYTTPGSTLTTTGGTLTGSVVIGKVGDSFVPLHLVRESTTSYGMRLHTPQPQDPATMPAPGAFDGTYAIVDSSGSNAMATIAGTSYTRAPATATLTHDSPVRGVIAVSGGLTGKMLANAGILGFIPASGTPVFELGVLN